jgi:hypothetical protein
MDKIEEKRGIKNLKKHIRRGSKLLNLFVAIELCIFI